MGPGWGNEVVNVASVRIRRLGGAIFGKRGNTDGDLICGNVFRKESPSRFLNDFTCGLIFWRRIAELRVNDWMSPE